MALLQCQVGIPSYNYRYYWTLTHHQHWTKCICLIECILPLSQGQASTLHIVSIFHMSNAHFDADIHHQILDRRLALTLTLRAKFEQAMVCLCLGGMEGRSPLQSICALVEEHMWMHGTFSSPNVLLHKHSRLQKATICNSAWSK